MSQWPISLAAGNVQEFAPEDIVRAAAGAGFDYTGLWVDPDTWSSATTEQVKDALDAVKTRVLDVEVIWLKPGKGLTAGHQILDIGGELNARFGLVVSSHDNNADTCREFTELCSHALDVGMTLVLEFLPITCVTSLAQAVQIVIDSDAPNAGVLVDTLHLARTGATPADVQTFDTSLFPYVQIADAAARPVGDNYNTLLEEAVDGRLLPGEGQLPIRDLLDVLPMTTPLSPEIRSLMLREQFPQIGPRSDAIARATREFLAG